MKWLGLGAVCIAIGGVLLWAGRTHSDEFEGDQ